jgi:transposase
MEQVAPDPPLFTFEMVAQGSGSKDLSVRINAPQPQKRCIYVQTPWQMPRRLCFLATLEEVTLVPDQARRIGCEALTPVYLAVCDPENLLLP